MDAIRLTKRSVLFVCYGNICRSPMAEAIFLDLLSKTSHLDEWTVDSAGILDLHLGKGPYSLTIETLHNHGITQYSHKVRQISKDDFKRFQYILAMDEENLRDLRDLEKGIKEENRKAHVQLLGHYDPKGQSNVLDPYYTPYDKEAFETAFDHCLRACQNFLESCYEDK